MAANDAKARRLFANILRSSAQSYKASAEVTLRYAEMIESGTSSAVEVEDLMKKYPAFAGSGTATTGSSKQNKNKKDREEDMKIIMFKPSTTDDGDTKKRKRPAKKPKDPNAPKRPPNAFILFQNSVVSQKKRDNPDMRYQEVQQEISRMWGDLSAEAKKPYQDATEIAKVDYEKSKREYEAGLAAAALEIDMLGGDDSDEGRPGESALVKGKSSSVAVKTSKSKVVDKKKAKKVAVAPPVPTASSDDATSGDEDEIDSDSDEEEEEEPPKKKVKKRMSPSPSRAKKENKENVKVRK